MSNSTIPSKKRVSRRAVLSGGISTAALLAMGRPLLAQGGRPLLAQGGRPLLAQGGRPLLAQVGRPQGALPTDDWAMRLSTSSIQFMSLPIEQACARIAALGFEAIDIWSPHAGCPHLDDAVARLGPEGLRELLARHKLKPYAYSVYAGGFAKYADFIGQMGGGVAIQGSTGPCPPEDIVPRTKQFLEAVKPLADLAAERDSYLAIENHGHALLDSLDSLKAFVDLNRHPRLGIALAPYHLQRREASVEEAIAIAGEQLLFFYAWQNAPGLKQLPGIGPTTPGEQGSTDVTPWLAALAKVDYRWYVNPFMHGEPEPDAMSEALGRSRAYLQDCRERAGVTG